MVSIKKVTSAVRTVVVFLEKDLVISNITRLLPEGSYKAKPPVAET